MASVSGYIINLPEAVERRERLERHLHQLGIASHYTWFEAQRGADESNARRGLSPGEDGLWRSVLHLLERAELGSADYLHIVEDDVELSRQFWQWLCALAPQAPQEHILFTDMYAGCSVFTALLGVAQQIRQRQEQGWLGGQVYTGCTTSWLIHRQHLDQVHQRLLEAYNQPTTRIPIDNLLRRLLQTGHLSARISLPFLTSIHLGAQMCSSIQLEESPAVQSTRLLGTVLRRRLSVLSTAQDLLELGPLLEALLGSDNTDQWLAEVLIPHLHRQGALRYRRDPRLLVEPGNPQATATG
jgi:hypothetical protein